MKKSLNSLIHNGFQGKELLISSAPMNGSNIRIERKQITKQYSNSHDLEYSPYIEFSNVKFFLSIRYLIVLCLQLCLSMYGFHC